jgi:DNA-binding NarL/FixJ family response regulator
MVLPLAPLEVKPPESELSESRPRVLLVDDQPLFLEALAAMLLAAPELEVVGRVEDGEQALDAARSLSPDLVLMDIDMPRMDGIEATRRIVAEHPEAAVIMVTGSALSEDEERARSAGASGYVTKDRIACDLLPAVRASFPSLRLL